MKHRLRSARKTKRSVIIIRSDPIKGGGAEGTAALGLAILETSISNSVRKNLCKTLVFEKGGPQKYRSPRASHFSLKGPDYCTVGFMVNLKEYINDGKSVPDRLSIRMQRIKSKGGKVAVEFEARALRPKITT